MLESAGLGGEFIQIFARTGNHARIEERRNRKVEVKSRKILLF